MVEPVERVAVVASLQPGAAEAARELVELGPPFDPASAGLRRHAVYLSAREVVFVFEGPAAERRVARVVDDMAISASFAAWGQLLASTPRLAHQAYHWERSPRALEAKQAW
jgi:hypothetical protein